MGCFYFNSLLLKFQPFSHFFSFHGVKIGVLFGSILYIFFGFYDGHGGKKASDFVAKNLQNNVFEMLKNSKGNYDKEEAVKAGYLKTDEDFFKQFLQPFLDEKPKKRKLDDENARDTFIDDDDVVDGPELNDSNNEDDDLSESVCALCDNGGNLLFCDGRCMRSFHPTEDDESVLESACDSLAFTPKQVKPMEVEGLAFLCKNCEYNQHQCFACGKLGFSYKSSGAEVFRCSDAICGSFYNPHCVVAFIIHYGMSHRRNIDPFVIFENMKATHFGFLEK